MRFHAGCESEVTCPPYPPRSISSTSPRRLSSTWNTVASSLTSVHSQCCTPATGHVVSSPYTCLEKKVRSSRYP